MFKKSLYLLALVAGLASCNGDYTDWANPQSNGANGAAENFTMTVTPGITTVDFATETADSIQLFTTNLTEGQTDEYTVFFTSEEKGITNSLTVAPSGKIATADLEKAVTDIYGKAPQARTLSTAVRAYVTVTTADGNVTVQRTSQSFNFTGTPNAPYISEHYYIVGAPSEWSVTCTTLPFTHSGSNVYDDPEFTVTFPVADGEDTWFAISDDKSLESGEWSALLGCAEGNGNNGMEGKIARRSELSDDGSWKISVNGDAKFVKMTINMMDYTYKIEKINFSDYIYYAGDWTSWQNNKKELALTDADNGIYEGYYYISAVDNQNTWGFKFIDADGNWYGDAGNNTFSTAAGGNMNPGDGGFYKIKVDWANSTYALTPITTVGVIGDATANGWNGDTPLTYNTTDGCWEGTVTFTDGTFKFRANGAWDINWGGSLDNLTNNGDNISVSAGTYKVQFYPNCPGKAYATLTKLLGKWWFT